MASQRLYGRETARYNQSRLVPAAIVDASMNIPLARPDLTEREIEAVTAVLRTPYLSLGPKLAEFESVFAERCQVKHAVAVSSGTAALHLCWRTIGLQPGDEVVTTPFSFIASSNSILFQEGVPAFVDVDPDTWDIAAEAIEAAITDRTRAILPVHVFGHMCDIEAILAVARRHGLRVIEDSAEALGSSYDGKPAGSLGDAGVFAFYPNKQITTGEGGMIVTDDDEIASLARSLRNQGRDQFAGGSLGGWLDHQRLGYNYRISDINCALGIAQMGRLDEILAKRRRVAEIYRRRLADEPRLRLQQVRSQVEVSWFVFVVRLGDEYGRDDRDRILTQLRARGVGCSNYFTPIHLQPFYVERFGFEPGDLPVCEALSARTLALPFHGGLTDEQIHTVCDTLVSLL